MARLGVERRPRRVLSVRFPHWDRSQAHIELNAKETWHN